MGYKRTIFLINPPFQIRFSLYVAILVFISSLVYPWVLWDVLTSFIGFIAEKSPEIATQVKKQREVLLSLLIIWQLGFTFIVFIACIFFSHKIAGPIFKLQKFLAGIRDGNPHGELYFRKGDYFQEVADDFNDTFDGIQENQKKDFVYLSEVSAYINNLSLVVPDDKKVVLNEINKRLNEIQERFNNL